ncbi:MAG TPA: threonine synthase [Candidatus Dormibacteraeota bacterium]
MTRAFLRCSEPSCGLVATDAGPAYSCATCQGLLEVAYEFGAPEPGRWRELWRDRRQSGDEADRSGVWRFRELLPFLAQGAVPITLGEGSTPLVTGSCSAAWAGLERLELKHQGVNPTGSFKDLGMTACISQAVAQGASLVACASTGNTSSSMAAYAARAGLRALLVVPRGAVSTAKLAQAVDFGALVVEAEGNFDQALRMLRRVAPGLGCYLVNSINPYRIEGQKTVVVELLEQRGWVPPDWIVVPGGNLGNVSAVGKGLMELSSLGLIVKVPRLLVVQAEGANPFFKLWTSAAQTLEPVAQPETRATAIRIGNPANWPKALRALRWSEGECESVSDQEIEAAKQALSLDGIGCEPASATTLAGLRKLRVSGRIEAGADVVAVLTGHQLKDVDYLLETRRPALPALRLNPDDEAATGLIVARLDRQLGPLAAS